MLREIPTAQLTVGMYVSDLDRPWLDTPFPVQGFYIRSSEDIGRLADHCHHVFVDPRRYDARLASAMRRLTIEPEACAPTKLELPPRSVEYDDDSEVEDELPAAREALQTASARLTAFWDELAERRPVRIEAMRQAVDPMVESILRNKDALVALMRVRRTDRHTHDHCLAMAVWAGLMGRQLGLPPADVKRLALGCSLVDVGMVRLPQSLLERVDALLESEREVLRSHVDFSLDMLAHMGADDEALAAIVRWHHERMDGSGYPDRLAGGNVPMHARIAGIVDSYDGLISPRDSARGCSSFEALTTLQRDIERFQPELLEQFARAVGLFPSGALVELNSGEVAVVFSQNTGRRLRPKVMLILDADKYRRDSFPIVDLKADSEHRLRIARELPRGAYGVDAQEYFL